MRGSFLGLGAFPPEIFFAIHSNTIVASFFTYDESLFSKNRESSVNFISGFVDIISYNGWGEYEPAFREDLKYPIIDGQLHPLRRLSSRRHFEDVSCYGDLSYSNNLLVCLISSIHVKFYGKGSLIHVVQADAVLSGGAVRREKDCGAVLRARHRVGRTDMKPYDAGDIESIPPGQT